MHLIFKRKRVLSLLTLITLSFIGCKSTSSNSNIPTPYKIHKDITTTLFWVGEKASSENKNIPNDVSAWDDMWVMDYNGIDNPNRRDGYFPQEFIPKENPFYFALPYDDFDKNGEKKPNLSSYIPWATYNDDNKSSVCKNRWIKIVKDGRVAYAQWEDVGPVETDDKEYVFGTQQPQNQFNNNAGLDLSPAVHDYLHLSDIDTTDWQFIDEKDVPFGPWKRYITKSGIKWIDWYKPDINSSWQWQLQGDINSSYNVNIYDIDLFDSNKSLIQSLQKSGKKVICYLSVGSWENWREDKDKFPQIVLGNTLDAWKGERWLDISNKSLLPIMQARLDLAVQKGCDGIEADNMDGYANNTGFSFSALDQLNYNKFIANEAHKRGLSVGLKNDLDQVKILEPFFDFALNEQCHIYEECDLLQPFIDANKPVFNAEYAQKYVDNINGQRDELCRDSKRRKFQTLILPISLDGSFRFSCKK